MGFIFERKTGNEKINSFNYQKLDLNSGLLLIPGYNKKNYLSCDDHVEVGPHPFVFFKSKNQDQNKGYLSPLTSVKKMLFNYKTWVCQCNHKYKDVLIKNNKFLFFDIRKSKFIRKPSLIKFTQEYEIDDLTLKSFISDGTFKVIENKIEDIFLNSIFDLKSQEKCLKDFIIKCKY